MTQQNEKGTESARQAVTELTPEMVEAGVVELRERHYGEPLSDIVTDVFIAMLAARR